MASLTRREGLQLALGAAALIAAPGARAATGGLHAIATAKGLRFGSCTAAAGGGSIENPRYAALLKSECGLLVAENEMKWQALRPSAGSFDFAAADRILAFAAANNQAMRGHTLLWHRAKWMPGWLETHDFGARPATAAEAMLTDHITTVCNRYKGRIASWDVVNETVLPEDGVLAQTRLSSAIGGTETLVDLAFHTARRAAPGVQLVYNDYMSWEPGNEAHRAGVLRLLEGFRKRGTPVDALGVQSHLVITDPARPQERAWRDFIEAVVGMGYALVISEFDVRDAALPADAAQRDAGVAATARSYFDMMLSYPALRDVMVWGLVDPWSWLQSFEPRKDGKPSRGNPYDADYAGKPLRDALAAALAAAAPR